MTDVPPPSTDEVPATLVDPLALLRVPFVFSQDGLLGSDEFVKQAKQRGHDVSVDGLRRFHELGLLLPLFWAGDDVREDLRIDVTPVSAHNPWGWTVEAARDGKLRDPQREVTVDVPPYHRPADVPRRSGSHWWNGYTYSPWQLLDLHSVINQHKILKAGWRDGPDRERVERTRRRVYALAVLSPRFLSGVLGQIRLPPGSQGDTLWQVRHQSNALQFLQIAGFDPADLRVEAEALLHLAKDRDPLADWLPLIRHASYRAWSRLKGDALDCIWLRIGAEVLLRAHESLAADGHVEPLPSLEGTDWWQPLHDRIGPHTEEADSLERALGTYGLSPHPRVLLIVEGETELDHVPRLLSEFGLSRPEQVRVQLGKGSRVNAHLIARYGIAPRLGKTIHGTQLIDRTPTALILAMDPENKFASKQKCDTERRNLQNAIREEVRLQGGRIGQADLDYLVEIRVWGEDKYELANFTDDELVPAITELARQQNRQDVDDPAWQTQLRAGLAAARSRHDDIKVPMGQSRVTEDKTELARLLWPTLIAKVEAELAANEVLTPVLALIVAVREKVAMLSGPGYSLQDP
jgi:hypothetical protein